MRNQKTIREQLQEKYPTEWAEWLASDMRNKSLDVLKAIDDTEAKISRAANRIMRGGIFKFIFFLPLHACLVWKFSRIPVNCSHIVDLIGFAQFLREQKNRKIEDECEISGPIEDMEKFHKLMKHIGFYDKFKVNKA